MDQTPLAAPGDQMQKPCEGVEPHPNRRPPPVCLSSENERLLRFSGLPPSCANGVFARKVNGCPDDHQSMAPAAHQRCVSALRVPASADPAPAVVTTPGRPGSPLVNPRRPAVRESRRRMPNWLSKARMGADGFFPGSFRQPRLTPPMSESSSSKHSALPTDQKPFRPLMRTPRAPAATPVFVIATVRRPSHRVGRKCRQTTGISKRRRPNCQSPWTTPWLGSVAPRDGNDN